MEPTPRMYLAPLTVLRFFAALHVVTYHVRESYLQAAPSWLWELVARGYVAVSAFFVLSGFILTYTYLASGPIRDRRAFWIARFSRIYPMYLLSLLIAAPSFFGILFHENPAGTALSRAALAVVTVGTMTQAWSPTTATMWNLPAWSLSAEAFFYATFPFIAALLMRLSTRKLIAGVALSWLASLVPPLAYEQLGSGLTPEWELVIAYNPLARLPEFVIGILLGHLFLRHKQHPHSLILSSNAGVVALGAGAVLVAGLIATSSLSWLLVGNGLFAPLFGILIYSLAMCPSGPARLLSLPGAVLLGEASYAMYLLHAPLTGWLRVVAKRIPNGQAMLQEPLFLAVYLALITGISILAFLFIEKPARRVLRRRLGTQRGLVGSPQLAQRGAGG